jgi:hypothetical protein
MKKIKQDSIWQNNKNKTLYRVIAIARDKYWAKYVIYQKECIPKSNFASFLARHSESLHVGRCDLVPMGNKLDWFIEFDGKPDDSEIKVWARPIEMWHEKFTYVDN